MAERIYNHVIVDGEILLPDKRSLKAAYGLNHPEAYDPSDSRFLAEVLIDHGNQPPRRAFIVSPPSEGWDTYNYGRVHDRFSIVEEEQPDGGYSEMGVHESRIWRNVTEQRNHQKNQELYELVGLVPQAFINQKEDVCVNVESLSTRVELLKQTVKS